MEKLKKIINRGAIHIKPIKYSRFFATKPEVKPLIKDMIGKITNTYNMIIF